MKLMIFTDNHFCSYSSIVRQRGDKYTLRLENQIKSLDYMEEIAQKEGCDEVICLGDFFDKPTLNDEELTALKDIKWSSIPHKFIVGNHESSVNGLEYNSTKTLEKSNFEIISTPTLYYSNVNLVFLPYIIESDRKPLSEYMKELNLDRNRPTIVFSHNDIKDLQMGAFKSTQGFSVDEIENNCDLFINGHLHNGTKFCKNGINLGNLTGQNFSEDAYRYEHNMMILDTVTMKYKLIPNIYAFNFYKMEVLKDDDIVKYMHSLRDNAVVTIKTTSALLPLVNNALNHSQNIIANKVLVSTDITTELSDKAKLTNLSVDHLTKFVEFCKERINNNEVLNQELNEVCK